MDIKSQTNMTKKINEAKIIKVRTKKEKPFLQFCKKDASILYLEFQEL